jgi:hypothetical protein
MNDEMNDGVGRATNIGLAEALLLLRTWAEDKTLVRCELLLGSLAAGFRGRAVAASGTEFRLMSDDTWTELTLPLRAGFRFGYTDMRDSPEHSSQFDNLLVVFFPYHGDPDQADKIVLYEIKE